MLDHSKQTHAYMQWIGNFMTPTTKIIFTDKKTYDLVFHSYKNKKFTVI